MYFSFLPQFASELKEKGQDVDFDALLQEIKARDAADSSRAVAPLIRLPEMHYVDSSDMSRDQVIETIHSIAAKELEELSPRG